ncbi:Carbohydrate-binding protein [Phytophthora megakarya]|uniref:Carbohydrate-binding protein n=1 Tax=Phytophthora megakarya TaxID=4795 RepID=A0A225USK3_9STRA|nr:Carbohydrate-binding protein [Phytophthora megakarya]
MKISAMYSIVLMTVMCLFNVATAGTESLTLRRLQSPNGALCYKVCPTGQYCPRGEISCRAPTEGLCFNPGTGLFQRGCDLGFRCSNGKCVYNSNPPSGAPICYKTCPSGQYCARGETQCRAPSGGLCFNPATSLFQRGCATGFKCSNGKCVRKTTTPSTVLSITESTSFRTTINNQSPNGALCYKACPTGRYCARGDTVCRAPTGDLCFNTATSLFQHGCATGFKCSYGKCVYQ